MTFAALVVANGVSSIDAATATITSGKGNVYNDNTLQRDQLILFASTISKQISKVQTEGSVWDVQCYYAKRFKGGYRVGIRAKANPGGSYLYLLLDDFKTGTDRAYLFSPFPDKEDDPPFCGFGDGLLYTPLMRNVTNGSFRTRAI
jgi:hypothetical protein